MNLPSPDPSSRNRRCRGFTLVELMVASGVAVMVLGVTMVLLIESAKENRRGVADASVEQAASDLQSKIIFYLRGMSASEGVLFSAPVTNGSGAVIGYQSVIVARGPAPDNPRQEISFNTTQGQALYNPDRSSTNTPAILIQPDAHRVLRMLSFSPSLKADGTLDNALVNVTIKLDDNGSSGRSGSNPANVWRSFAVSMRNN